MQNKITVTSPLLPDLKEFHELLKDIWQRRWITNNGHYHQELEKALAEYLKVPYLSLFTNGTLPLITALQAMDVKGEVITTPYSFVATTHVLRWNGITPVFVDIDPLTGNMNPDKIEGAITSKTTAIMPVHVYGNPCDTKRIQEIADKYGLKVIYDAAHAFGVEVPASSYGLNPYDERGMASILNAGTMSSISFHATKTFNTIEGGALIVHDKETKKFIDNIKNFGIRDELTVVAPGINGKMDEVRSAYGLLNLLQLNRAIEKRRQVAIKYCKVLGDIPGITLFPNNCDIRQNYSYFPIFVHAKCFGMTRDELYEKMMADGILCRRYFYPLISNLPIYKGLASAKKELLPIANKMAEEVLCLPIHHALTDEDVDRILAFFK